MPKLRIKISPEFSAQRRSHQINCAFQSALGLVRTQFKHSLNSWRVADLGCGKLRHYAALSGFPKLYLVDTEKQLSMPHVDGGETYTVREVAARARAKGNVVYAMNSFEFAKAHLELDLVVCIAVLDVVVSEVRKQLIAMASRNLRSQGICILVVPRNDSTILSRCRDKNRFKDGYVFAHHGTHTFFHNFRSYSSIVAMCMREELTLIEDLSTYRQVCLVFSRKNQKKKRLASRD